MSDFHRAAEAALADETLHAALAGMETGFVAARARAVARLPEFERLRDAARDIKDHVLGHLDAYLERFAAEVTARGGSVHWCADAKAARETVLAICREAGATTVTKSKSMISEEIGLNDFLAANGVTPVETDLGEYIVQLAHEPPSHIIAPAIHKTQAQVAELFAAHHGSHPDPGDARALLDEARAVLRAKYFAAGVGITGANFLVAETGSVVVVTNEGNADLTQVLPPVHVVVTSIEKIVPTLEDAAAILRVLARSATGQEFSTYTTVTTGPKRPEDADGAAHFHVVLLDNGRSEILGGPFGDILRCIRCGACLDHCPVYMAIGGHAYGSVYSGPMGAVLSPALDGLARHHDLPNASTLCGRCESVCPVRIPLPALLRRWRMRAFAERLTPPRQRLALGLWGWFARRPRLYRRAAALAIAVLSGLAGGRGRFSRLPGAGGWTAARDLPAPEGGTFLDQWRARR